MPSKTLDFGTASKATSAEPATPTTPFVAAKDEALDYNQFVIDTLLWTNRVRSGFYLLAGSLLILAFNYMLNAGTPLLTGERCMGHPIPPMSLASSPLPPCSCMVSTMRHEGGHFQPLPLTAFQV